VTSTEVTTLIGLDTGVYDVTTSSGTYHVIDLDRQSATRYGALGHEWTEHSSPDGVPDTEPFFFTRLSDAAVGRRMYLFNKGGYLDSDYWRLTSEIQRIAPHQWDFDALEETWSLTSAQMSELLGVDTMTYAMWHLTDVPVEHRRQVEVLEAITFLLERRVKAVSIAQSLRRPLPAFSDRSLLEMARAGEFHLLAAAVRSLPRDN